MGSFSIWHWIVVLLFLGIPAVMGLIIWLLVRASKGRSAAALPPATSLRSSSAETPDSPNPYAAPNSFNTSQNSLAGPPPVPSKPRPWIRYWARMFDIYLACIVCGLAIGTFNPDAFSQPGSDQLFGIGVIFAWVLIESLLLSTAGTTPGKWLLKTRVVPVSGIKPNYLTALSRSYKVWWRGLGIGFPLASLVTLIVAHGKLTSNGITSWDRDDGFIVVHERIGPMRIVVAVLFFLGFFSLVVVGNSAGA